MKVLVSEADGQVGVKKNRLKKKNISFKRSRWMNWARQIDDTRVYLREDLPFKLLILLTLFSLGFLCLANLLMPSPPPLVSASQGSSFLNPGLWWETLGMWRAAPQTLLRICCCCRSFLLDRRAEGNWTVYLSLSCRHSLVLLIEAGPPDIFLIKAFSFLFDMSSNEMTGNRQTDKGHEMGLNKRCCMVFMYCF